VIYLRKILFVFVILFISSFKIEAEVNDSIFATVGNKVITRSDILNEIKVILITTGETFSNDRLDFLQASAVKTLIKRNIKAIEISKYPNLQYNKNELRQTLKTLSTSMNLDEDTLENTLVNNELNINTFTNIYKIELLWNKLIFELYKDQISINMSEIDDQLKLYENKEEIDEYFISEIVAPQVAATELNNEIKKIKNLIKTDGFESTALRVSISESGKKGGDIGWIKENTISNDLRNEIKKTKVGGVSNAVVLPEGILFFKIKDKRKVENIINLDQIKNELIGNEKAKILNMHSQSHYDKLRRSITIKYY
jgi:parvulin-like peptidyl-prolyl isomerase